MFGPQVAYGWCTNTPVGAELSGLSHLEGKTLKAIIDDSMHNDLTCIKW